MYGYGSTADNPVGPPPRVPLSKRHHLTDLGFHTFWLGGFRLAVKTTRNPRSIGFKYDPKSVRSRSEAATVATGSFGTCGSWRLSRMSAETWLKEVSSSGRPLRRG